MKRAVLAATLAALIAAPTAADTWDQVAASNALRDAERAVAAKERSIDRLQAERARALSKLRQGQTYRGTYPMTTEERLTRAQERQAYTSEAELIMAQYAARIDEKRREIDRLERRMEAVRRAR